MGKAMGKAMGNTMGNTMGKAMEKAWAGCEEKERVNMSAKAKAWEEVEGFHMPIVLPRCECQILRTNFRMAEVRPTAVDVVVGVLIGGKI